MEHEHSILYEPFNHIWRLAFGFDVPDHVIMALLVLLISCIVFPLASRKFSKDNPGGFQQFLEIIVSGLKALLEDIVGHGASHKFLYIIGGFATFIFVSNLFGLFFFLQPPTGTLSTTVALALLSFLYFNFQGIKEHGFFGYLKHFMGPVLWLAPLFFVIEIIGNFARILSLSLRLFMNIYGEHTATSIFAGLVPIVVPWPLMALGLFTALLQAFIFATLSSVYISLATAHEEH